MLDETVKQIQAEIEQMWLIINEEKAKYMKNTRSSGFGNNVVLLNRHKYNEVDSFKYLGVLITAESNADVDMRHKIAEGNICLRTLNKILNARCKVKKQN